MVEGLRLKAQRCDDLEIISSLLQDALFRVDCMTYQAGRRRFAFVANRFKWEREVLHRKKPKNAATYERVRSGLRFEGVLSVQTRNLSFTKRDRVLSLLAITCERKGEDYLVRMIFSGDAEIRMKAEVLEVYLDDLTGAWQTGKKPEHSPA